VDWIEKSLATSADSMGISESAQQRFSTENGIEVKRMTWLKRPKDGAQFGSAIVKVATKAEAEKLLSSRPTFGGGSVTATSFKCANCSGPHKAFDRQCKVYAEEAKRISNLRLNDQIA
ncbi:hypothetical protein LTR04_002649, partial [Oleoguttula sp. CCFEE 6159]